MDEDADGGAFDSHLLGHFAVRPFLDADQPKGFRLLRGERGQLAADDFHQFLESGPIPDRRRLGDGKPNLSTGVAVDGQAPSASTKRIDRPPRRQPAKKRAPIFDRTASTPLQRLGEDFLTAIERIVPMLQNPRDRAPNQ